MLADSIQLTDGAQIQRSLIGTGKQGTSFPVSPADGESFELTATYQGRSPGIYTYVAAESAWVVKYPGNDVMPYDISGSSRDVLANGAVIAKFLTVRGYRLKSGFENCLANCILAPVVDTTLSIIRIARTGSQTEVGSIFYAAGETIGIFSQVGSGDIVFSAGETLVVKAPAVVDQSISEVSFTLAGTLV